MTTFEFTYAGSGSASTINGNDTHIITATEMTALGLTPQVLTNIFAVGSGGQYGAVESAAIQG